MRILSAHAGADTAGIGWGLHNAFRAHSDHVLRSAVRSTNYIDYPRDLPWVDAALESRRADVLHLHNSLVTAYLLLASGKPKVLHHHGTHYRDNADRLNREAAEADARCVVATLDLLDYGDDLTWIPHPFDPTALPQRVHRDGPLRVGHAPTDRAVKSTQVFLDACNKVRGIEPVLIERTSWRDCLKAKATCDVYYDQVQLGYGCNATEAMFMGIPVIAGAQPATLAAMTVQFDQLPFLLADETTIADALHAMLNPDVRDEHTRRGLLHAHTWHDGRETVNRLTPIYEALCTSV